jgi:hypothetical protein
VTIVADAGMVSAANQAAIETSCKHDRFITANATRSTPT